MRPTFALWALLTLGQVCAQSDMWISIQAERELGRHESITVGEAALLHEARIKAVESATGVTVRSADMHATAEFTRMEHGKSNRIAHWFEDFIYYSRQEISGRVIEEKTPAFATREVDGKLIQSIVYEGRIALDKEVPDPGFETGIATRQPSYRVGDTIRIDASSTRDALLYLFNMDHLGTGTLIWPNPFDTDNRIAAKKRLTLPQNDRYYAFVAELKEDASVPDRSGELVFAIFYKGQGNLFDPADAFTRKFDLAEINRLLLKIPRHLRSEAMGVFTIAP